MDEKKFAISGKPVWLKFLVAAFLFALVLEPIRASNDIALGGLGNAASAIAIVGPLLIVIGVLGVGLIWSQSRAGYVIALVLGAFLVFVSFFFVDLGILATPIQTIRQASGVFFVWVVMMLRVTATLTVVLSIYGLTRGSKGVGD